MCLKKPFTCTTKTSVNKIKTAEMVKGEWNPKVENSQPPKSGPNTLPNDSNEAKIPIVVPCPSFVCLETKEARVGFVIEDPAIMKAIKSKRNIWDLAKGIRNKPAAKMHMPIITVLCSPKKRVILYTKNICTNTAKSPCMEKK